MERIKAFEYGQKQVVYFDLSDIQSNGELEGVVESAKDAMNAFVHQSVYTITNVSRIAFDTKTKEIAADWMAFNKPYVINAAFVGATAIRKIMMSMVFTLSGRTNVTLWGDMEQALEWIDSL